jgi:uncharacterized protein (DUF849 family)
MDKLIINAAITGMVPTKSDSPHVPISVDEIVKEVKRCRDSGASIVHLHARDESGAPTYKKEVYARIYREVKEVAGDILISGSTSGRVFEELWQRSESLEPEPGLFPDLASLTLGSLNFPKQASVNSPSMIQALAKAMNDRGIIPEWECFDLGMIDYAHYLIEKSVLKKPFYCNLFLGSLGTISAKPENLTAMIKALPDGTTWAATGVGRHQFFINAMAVTMGGHVRVGLEDNLFYDEKKNQLATNAGLIERIVSLSKAVGREIASPHEARQIIGIQSRRHADLTV